MSTASPQTVRGLGTPRRDRLVPGEVLDGKYRILRLIAQGGTGAVYEGEHRLIARKVAIKVLHAHIADDEVAIRRFEREARATAQIGSENIVDVLDLGELPSGERYLVMEYLEGESLRDLMQRPVRPAEFVPLIMQLLTALSAAHRVGIIHRDVKPENVFIARRRPADPPIVKVLDFGVSKSQERRFDSEATSVGTIIGTPYYMAPEQALGNSVDPRADIYSVGVVMFQGLAGQLPYQVDSFTQLVVKLSLEMPPKLREVAPHVDPMLAAIVDQAMARAPDERFPSADALSDALGSWLARQSGRSDHGAVEAPGFGQPSRPGPRGPGPDRSTLRGVGAGPAPRAGYPVAPAPEAANVLPPTLQRPAQTPPVMPLQAPPGMPAQAPPIMPLQAPPGATPGLGFEIAADATIVVFARQRQRRLRGALAVLWMLVGLGVVGAVVLVVVPPPQLSAGPSAGPTEPTEPTTPADGTTATTTLGDTSSETEDTDAAAPEPTTSPSDSATLSSAEPTTKSAASAPKTKTPTSSGGSSKTPGGKGKTTKEGGGSKGAVEGRKIQTEL